MLKHYLNFDLLLDRFADQYQARVLASPAGEAVARFVLPFTDLELENYLLRLNARTQGMRRLVIQETDVAREFGVRLFEAVFRDDILRCLSASQILAEQQNAGLRLRLRLGDDTALAGIPWEFLHNPERNEVFALSRTTPLVRYLDIDRAAGFIALPMPLRILLMVSDAHAVAPLDTAREETDLYQALEPLIDEGLVEITRLPEASLNALQRELARREYHVFHYIGHGDLNASGEGVLYLTDRHGQLTVVSGQKLGILLRGHPLRLAVLNACLGARATSQKPFAGTAQSLVQIGLPAVIAMQFEISDTSAIAFSQSFYEALARHAPVDIAAVEGRLALFANEGAEWATPVTFLRADNGHIFTPPAEAPQKTKSARSASAEPGGVASVSPSVPRSNDPQTREALRELTDQAKRRFGADRPKVVLLYKRQAEPDETLVTFLEEQLKAAGCEVFLDRHLVVGTHWADEVSRKIRAADAVVPLLSAHSIHSEMLEYEIQTAYQYALEQQGRPRLLPIRAAYEGEMPTSLASILDAIQYTLWKTPQDDVALLGALLAGLQAATPPFDPDSLETPGGAVLPESPFYVVRPVDHELDAALARREGTILVKGARQMGKTSLAARGVERARALGAQVVFTDFQMLGAKHLATPETLLLTLAGMLANELKAGGIRLPHSPREIWDMELPAQSSMNNFLTECVFATFSEPLVWIMDEVDRLFSCDFAGEIFGLFRSWYNRRATDSGGPWQRLTLVISYATEAHLFIRDLNQSPFNVGVRLQMEDFTLDQVTDLNARYHYPLRDSPEIERFFQLVNGQPYLVRRGLYEMVQHQVDLATLERDVDTDQGVFGDHLRRILISLSRDPILTDVVRQILHGASCPDTESFFRLRAAGLLAGDNFNHCQMRCRLYASYLSRHLL